MDLLPNCLACSLAGEFLPRKLTSLHYIEVYSRSTCLTAGLPCTKVFGTNYRNVDWCCPNLSIVLASTFRFYFAWSIITML